MTANVSVDFFEAQFRRQVEAGEYALNPFEELALPHLEGDLLDLGCGLGNLALAAARQGCRVTALDASPTAIARVRDTAVAEQLDVEAKLTDLLHYRIERHYDGIVCIGLLMFFPAPRALVLLEDIRAHVRPGGVAALNVLTEGTTFLDMFQAGHYHLFAQGELQARFAGWEVLAAQHDRFPAPKNTVKAFDTLIVRRPG